MIYWLIFTKLEIARNYVLIEVLKMRPHYGYSAMIRFAFGAIILLRAHPEFDPLGDPTTIFPTVNYALMQWSSFYLLFDVTLNKLRRKDWDYQGKNSGMTDSLSKTKYYLLKAAAVMILALSLILIYGKG